VLIDLDPKEVVISIFGSSGGVARAVLAILNRSVSDVHDPLHDYMTHCQIHLVDLKEQQLDYYKTYAPNLVDRLSLHQLDLKNIEAVRQHLIGTRTSLIIDVSWADTVEMLELCNELGVCYVNTALENAKIDEDVSVDGFTLIERYQIYERNKGRFTNTKAILCSGMNPGVVQWMAIHMLNERPEEMPTACYIVEKDSIFYKDKSLIEQQTVYSSWSPECFLDEAILNYPMYMSHHEPHFLYRSVYEIEFKVTLGQIRFYGCLMPHEEVITMAQLYDMEMGFIYRVNEHTTSQLQANVDDPDRIWNWKHKVLDPSEAELVGEDLVGVLLVYADKERYMYNVMENREIYKEFRVNATYFQVACGVYGAVCSLLLDEIKKGLYYVDELLLTTPSNYGKYVSYYMKSFVKGENSFSEGRLMNRMRTVS
jgi:homospermidine synthase